MRRRLRLAVGAGAVLAVSVAASMPVIGASPAGSGAAESAWVVVRDATVDGAPGTNDGASSSGEPISWHIVNTGHVRVSLDEIASDGVPIVSALASTGRRCLILGWSGTPVNVEVVCDDLGGIRTDTPFSLTYTNAGPPDTGLPGALAHYHLSTVDADSVPSATYSHSSNGETIAVDHLSTGKYRASLPGLGNAKATGTFLVTRYGGSGFCKVTSWGSVAGDLEADIACRDATGALADAKHDVLFLRKLGPEGFGGGPAAYLWADRHTQAAAYNPTTARSWQSNGQRSKIDRTAVGVYTVTFPGLPKGGAAVVSAYGSGTATCQLGSIRKSAAPARVQVRCFRPNGALVDSRFTLAWTK